MAQSVFHMEESSENWSVRQFFSKISFTVEMFSIGEKQEHILPLSTSGMRAILGASRRRGPLLDWKYQNTQAQRFVCSLAICMYLEAPVRNVTFHKQLRKALLDGFLCKLQPTIRRGGGGAAAALCPLLV